MMNDPNDEGREHPRLTYAQSLPLHGAQSVAVPQLGRPHSMPAGRRPQLQRTKSWSQAVKNYIKYSTASFFGVNGDNEENELSRWKERHRRLASRCYGQLKEDSESVDVPDIAPAIRRPEVPLHRQLSEVGTRQTRPRSRRKDSVVKMTWDGLAFVSSSLARQGTRRRRRRPPMRSRSYAPASIVDDTMSDGPPTAPPVVPATPVFSGFTDSETAADEVFFDKTPVTTPSPITTVPPRTPLRPLTASTTCSRWLPPHDHDLSLDAWSGISSPFPVPEQPPAMRRVWSNVMDRALHNSNRRQYGIGLVGRLFGRSFRRDRITSQVREQLDDLDDHRPFFTYWVTTIQVLITIISLAVYGFGPIGFEQTKHSGLVLMTSLSLQEVDYFEPDNFWLGPRAADLIHLGAKFVPCMRKDKHVFAAINKSRQKERHTACCIRNDNAGCVQSSVTDCSSLISTWQKWRGKELDPNRRESGSVCGQDPSHCSDPPSVSPNDWPDDITKWPICKKKITRSMRGGVLDHMACEVIGHPCCIGILGECRITTSDYCDFLKGFFHEEAFLCSQVSCLDDVCGMIRFFDPEVPDQVYRLWTSLFLHAGLIHLAITVVVQYFLMRDLEKMAGCLRIGVIYLMSGIAGNLASAIFIPYRAEVGPAGSQFGLLACLFVEVINTWPILKSPGVALIKLSSVILLLFVLGLLPWVDNYAHVVGFVFGFLLSYALLPFVSFGKYDRQYKIVLIGVCLVLAVVLLSVLLLLFYVYPIYECDACSYFNCIPLTSNMCANQNIKITVGEF